ncbi:gliding motility-associated ABC transporter permease subunit GldF [Ulvibacterium sp.]|uniref:gliding motility-associated ABC transporter permease subunit GldF n=1 Tax=Ulvibacterium sp. TaxID=2665914 RepID=UPI002608A289|nr:gliding motility-associated ABC transporter permease subunit GldF [Ulvibacterium sp.]
MLAIFKREIQSFFTSSIGYLVIGLFFLLNGLFLWVFQGPFNIFDYGFADLGNFFLLAPWIFLLLIPALTMRSFSEEKKLGTLELQLIKPITHWQLVMGKFLGTFALVLTTLLPTFLYVHTISQLGVTPGNLDLGLVYGSYIGLLFLAATYNAIGLFTSVLNENQIMAFMLSTVLCFFMYYGFEALATLIPDSRLGLFIKELGMKAHFESVARGVLDSRDLIYFISLTGFFLGMIVIQLKYGKR